MPNSRGFRDRRAAARRLAAKLTAFAGRSDVVVVGLPRGGVVTAAEIADELHAPLDIVAVRKLGTPGQEELAMGAVAHDITVVNHEVVKLLAIAAPVVDAVAARAREEAQRLEADLRGSHPPVDIEGKVVIVADDGLATGSTMRAAIAALRRKHPAKIVLAIPVAPPDVCSHFTNDVDEVICLAMPQPFGAVAFWYEEFEPVPDREVIALLDKARRRELATA